MCVRGCDHTRSIARKIAGSYRPKQHAWRRFSYGSLSLCLFCVWRFRAVPQDPGMLADLR
jgi:hypothetical protein